MTKSTIEKLDMSSPNLVNKNIEAIAALFPNCVTETAEGKTIDFDLLKQELSPDVVDGMKERYRLEWPGKKEAVVTANLPTTKTLRPIREYSVDFDNTENIYIEGDNLEVLKLLQESYFKKIKMIYIDPPYNTGGDFIYRDDFSQDTAEHKEKSGLTDDYSRRLVVNLDTSGRFHSDWLSMIYPRLKLAKNLLADDGVIFISIDDNELHNLRKVCDEIFGENNFVACFIWEKRTNRENRKIVSVRHDYVVCYCLDAFRKEDIINLLPMSNDALDRYRNPDNDPRGPWKSDPAHAQAGHGTKSQFYVLKAPNGKEHVLPSGRCWVYTEDAMEEAIKDNRIWFGADGNNAPRIKTYLYAKERGLTPESILFASEVSTNERAKNDLKKLFDGISVFDTPKPVELLDLLIKIGCKDGIILDFFAGSSATAHSVIKSNSLDGGNRKFILIQLPEEIEQGTEAYQNGYRNICDIGRERIKRASSELIKRNAENNQTELTLMPEMQLDTGFRVYRLDESNFQDIYYRPQDYQQSELELFVDNIKPGRTNEDLVVQIMIDWGLPLSYQIENIKVLDKQVFKIASNSLLACFDNGLDEIFAKEIAKQRALRVVFRDSSFKDDTAKENVKQLLKQLSPETEMRVI